MPIGPIDFNVSPVASSTCARHAPGTGVPSGASPHPPVAALPDRLLRALERMGLTLPGLPAGRLQVVQGGPHHGAWLLERPRPSAAAQRGGATVSGSTAPDVPTEESLSVGHGRGAALAEEAGQAARPRDALQPRIIRPADGGRPRRQHGNPGRGSGGSHGGRGHGRPGSGPGSERSDSRRPGDRVPGAGPRKEHQMAELGRTDGQLDEAVHAQPESGLFSVDLTGGVSAPQVGDTVYQAPASAVNQVESDSQCPRETGGGKGGAEASTGSTATTFSTRANGPGGPSGPRSSRQTYVDFWNGRQNQIRQVISLLSLSVRSVIGMVGGGVLLDAGDCFLRLGFPDGQRRPFDPLVLPALDSGSLNGLNWELLPRFSQEDLTLTDVARTLERLLPEYTLTDVDPRCLGRLPSGEVVVVDPSALAERIEKPSGFAASGPAPSNPWLDRFTRQDDRAWLERLPPRRRASDAWSAYREDLWEQMMIAHKYDAGNYKTPEEVAAGETPWNTDYAYARIADQMIVRMLRNGGSLPTSLGRVAGFSTGPNLWDFLAFLKLAKTLGLPLRDVALYEPVPDNRELAKAKLEGSVAEDRVTVIADIMGISLDDAATLGVGGSKVTPRWAPVDSFNPDPSLFGTLDVETCFYGDDSVADSPVALAELWLNKMRMLRPGGIMHGVSEAESVHWKGYGGKLPACNTPLHLMCDILRILDPEVVIEVLEPDLATTDDHVDFRVVMFAAQKAEDFEDRIDEIKQRLIDRLSLPDQFALDGMPAPRAVPAVRAHMVNDSIVPIGGLPADGGMPSTLLAIRPDSYGDRQVFAIDGPVSLEMDIDRGMPITHVDGSVIDAQPDPIGNGWLAVLDHTGGVWLYNMLSGEEQQVFAGGQVRGLGPWSPAGDEFVVTTDHEVHLVNIVNPSAPRRLMHDEEGFWRKESDHGDGTRIPQTEWLMTGATERLSPLAWNETGALFGVRRLPGQGDELWHLNPHSGGPVRVLASQLERDDIIVPEDESLRQPWGAAIRDDGARPPALHFDSLHSVPNSDGISLVVRADTSHSSLYMSNLAVFEPVRGEDDDVSGRLRLVFGYADDVIDYSLPGVRGLHYKQGHLRVAAEGGEYRTLLAAATHQGDNSRAIIDHGMATPPVVVDNKLLFTSYEMYGGPRLSIHDLDTPLSRRNNHAPYHYIVDGKPSRVDLWGVPGGLLMFPLRDSPKAHTGPRPVLIWLGGLESRAWEHSPLWLEELAAEHGVAVLMPNWNGFSQEDGVITLHSEAGLRKAVEGLHQIISFIPNRESLEEKYGPLVGSMVDASWTGEKPYRIDSPEYALWSMMRTLDRSKVLVAGGELAARFRAAYPDDSIGTLYFPTEGDTGLAGAALTPAGGPLLMAAGGATFESLRPTVERLRANGVPVVTVNALDEHGNRFRSARNEAALRLVVTQFALDVAQPQLTPVRPPQEHPVSEPVQPTVWRFPHAYDPPPVKIPYAPLSGRPAPRLSRSGVVSRVSVKLDATDDIVDVTVYSPGTPKRRSELTMRFDALGRATLVDFKNPPGFDGLHRWAIMLAEAMQNRDVKTLTVPPLDVLPISHVMSGQGFYLADILAAAFSVRQVPEDHLRYRLEPTKDHPYGLWTLYMEVHDAPVRQRVVDRHLPEDEAPAGAHP